MNVEEFLKRASQVTENYRIVFGEWSLETQLGHTMEEIGEMLRAKNPLEELEEGWDVIFTILTRFHLKHYDNYAIGEAMKSTLIKIETRSRERLQEIAACPECGTIRERWNNGPTNWYCPKCKAGSA